MIWLALFGVAFGLGSAIALIGAKLADAYCNRTNDE